MKKRRWLVLVLVSTLVMTGAILLSGGSSAESIEAKGEGLELAVYNQNLALVKDVRMLDLVEGLNEVHFGDVAALIDPTSVHFRSVSDPEGTVVLEQNYEYDIVGSAKLLGKYVDHEIQLQTEDGQTYTGLLLSGDDDVILQTPEGQVKVIKLGQVKEFTFPALPEGLITRPTLVWQVQAAYGESHEVEVTYLTSGVNWQANYIVVLAGDDRSIDLDGWVTLDNRSGTSYEEAKLKLIAGDIHRAADEAFAAGGLDRMEMAPAAEPQVEERVFFEYHLYEVQRPVTVKNLQTKQIEFVTGSNIPADKFFVYDGAQIGYWASYQPLAEPSYGTASNEKVMVMLEFANSEEEGLGVPLPKGTLRVFQRDVDGSTLLVGEDAIDHTPKDEQVRLYVGDAFDIVGERIQTDFEVEYDEDWMEESFQITLRNHKDEDITVRVVEHMFRWVEWAVLEESHDHERLDAQTIEFRVPVGADDETTVTYRVRYEW